MKYLGSEEIGQAMEFIILAMKQANGSTCERSKCGSIIVKDDKIIGWGFNSPPANIDNQKKCNNRKEDYHRKVTDKTCCVHAEQRAIMEALKNNPDKLEGSTLYFIRLDGDGNLSFAGKPYCTICSKMALDVGIKSFVLYHKEGVGIYDTDEYNFLSYKYQD